MEKKNFKCLIGLHKMEFFKWSRYAYNLDAWNQRNLRQDIDKCSCCGKLSKMPKWYSEEFREKYPFVDLTGWPKEWKPEILNSK